MEHDANDIDQLATALYGLSAIRRDLQRCAGIQHAVGALMALGSVHRLGPARISDIAADLQVNLSVASRQIQALGADGYVDRVSDPHDGRSSLVALSPAGRAKLEAAHQRLSAALACAVDDWAPGQVTALADGITRLRTALAQPGETPVGAAADAAPPTFDAARPAPEAAGAAPRSTAEGDDATPSAAVEAGAPTPSATVEAGAPTPSATPEAAAPAPSPTLPADATPSTPALAAATAADPTADARPTVGSGTEENR